MSSIFLGGCSEGTIELSSNSEAPPPPSLPDDGSNTQNQVDDTAPRPPALPED